MCRYQRAQEDCRTHDGLDDIMAQVKAMSADKDKQNAHKESKSSPGSKQRDEF